MRTPCNSMAKGACSGAFDSTSLLRRAVSLRMIGQSGLALAMIWCFVIVFSKAVCASTVAAGHLPSLQQPPQTQTLPSEQNPAQQLPQPAPTSQAQPTTTSPPPSTATPQAGHETPAPSPAPAQVQKDDEARTPNTYDEIVVTAVGDVMLGTTFPDESTLPQNDGMDLLTEVTPFLKRGDVVYGNLEGPIVDGGDSAKCRGKKIGTCFAFRVPTRYGKYLKEAGLTAMGLANNHAMDFGLEGRASSRQVLDAMQIAHTGEIGDIARLTVKGRKVAIIAFATYPGAYNFLDLEESLQAIHSLKAEAELVIVGFHGGAEGATHQHVLEGDETFLGEDRGDLRRFTHAAIDAGADLVLGSGPHVVRAMEIYKGKLIAYSLGNFATYGPFNLSGENGLSLILEAHLADDGSFISGQVYPVKQEKPGGPKLDPAMSILPILRGLTKADFGATGVSVGPSGELRLPGAQVPECSNAPDMLDQPLGTRPCGIYP